MHSHPIASKSLIIKQIARPANIRSLLAAAVLSSGFGTSVAGETISKSDDGPRLVETSPAANLLSFCDGKVVLDVQERLRWEDRSNNFDFNSDARAVTDGNWFEQRFRFGVAVKPVDWLKIYAQGQDVREFDARRPNIPGVSGAEGDDAFDLRQGYVEIKNLEKCPWGLKLGRQELAYGDERLIGVSDWTNFARTFDAAKLTYHGRGFSVDAFASTPVVITRGKYDQSSLFNGDETARDLVLSGLYLTLDPLPFGTWDFYSFVLDQARGNVAYTQGLLSAPATKGSLLERSDFVTLGTRVKGDPKKLHGWEFSGEFAYQAGTVRGLNLSAFAINAGAGYNFLDVAWTPRIFAEYNYASGDDNPADGDLGTFQNLFPTNHKFYGIMDLFSWQNMQDAHLCVSAKPCQCVTAQLDYYAHWTATNNDVWYRANGLTAVRPLSAAAQEAGSYEGSEIDFILTWNAAKYFQLQGGFGHFFAGSYLKDTGAGDDANFGYVMASLIF